MAASAVEEHEDQDHQDQDHEEQDHEDQDHKDQDHEDQDHKGEGEDKRPAKGFGNFLSGSNLGFGEGLSCQLVRGLTVSICTKRACAACANCTSLTRCKKIAYV